MSEDLHAQIAALTARVNDLQRMGSIVNGLMVRIERLELAASSNLSAGGDAYAKIMVALNDHYMPVESDLASHTFKAIWETLHAGGLRLDGSEHAQKIAVARALVAFGAKSSRNGKGRIYRGLSRRNV
jgi:hypothetical protein